MKYVTSASTVFGVHAKTAALCAVALSLSLLASADAYASERVVFGSFRTEDNAENWARRLTQLFGESIASEAQVISGVRWFRVQTEVVDAAEAVLFKRKAEASGISYWRVPVAVGQGELAQGESRQESLAVEPLADTEKPAEETAVETAVETAKEPVRIRDIRIEQGQTRLTPPPGIAGPQSDSATDSTRSTSTRVSNDMEVGLQARIFAEEGHRELDQAEGSASLEIEHHRSWDQDRQSLTVTPFMRWDSQDSERSHFDVRELFWTRVADSWDLHVGARRVFWGVTEFHHLVDIVNQTDLIENIDGEDKLGQPMVQVSLVRDWGLLDVYALLGHRERTFPGSDGRFQGHFDIDDNGIYESGARELRTDFAIRWSNHLGPFELGIHHFSGTSRDPLLTMAPAGNELRPYYPVIDQSGIDALAITGDWAFKFEGMSRSGFGDRYSAFNVGLERTLVGIVGSADLGIVLEYMFDERDDEAFNTLFEHDIALGGRFAFNDFSDTQALFGVIHDTDSSDVVYSIEASRQVGADWLLSVEGRVFQGGRSAARAVRTGRIFDPDFKTAWLQDDDYVQLEFKKFF